MRNSIYGLIIVFLVGAFLDAQSGSDVMKRARNFLGERRYDQCLEILSTAPDVPERHRIEGEVRFFKGEVKAAASALERYLSLAGEASEVPRARFRLAECYSQLGRFAEAVQLTRKGLEKVAAPKRRMELARRLLERGLAAAIPAQPEGKPDYQKALRFFKEAEPFAGDDPRLLGELRFALGKTYFLQGKTREAVSILASLVGVDLPERFIANKRRQHRGGDGLPGLDVDRPCEEPRLDDVTVKEEGARIVGDALLELKQPGRAREVYRASFIRNPTGPEAPACLVGVARSLGFPRPAYRHALNKGTEALERLIKSFPEHECVPEVLDLLAKAHRCFNRLDRALHYLGDLVHHHPTSKYAPAAAREIARIHRGKKDYSKALEAYDQALAAFSSHRLWSEIRRERIDCEFQRAQDARNRGDRALASRLLEEFLENTPLDRRASSVLLALGQIAEKSGKVSEAAGYYSTLASKYPTSNEVSTGLLARARIEEEAGDFDAARATLKSIPRGGGRARLKEMEGTALSLASRHVDGIPTLILTARNLETVEMRLYRISAVDYFEKHHTLANVANLDVPLIRPNHTWTVKVKGYARYKRVEVPVKMPSEGPGAFVLSAVSGALRATTLVLRTDLRLVARMAGNRVDVVLGRSGELSPVEGGVILIAGGGRVLLRGKTGKDGNYTGQIPAHARPSGYATVLASVGDEVAWAQIRVPEGTRSRKGSGILLWTDRTRYRAGETLRFWALARNGAGDSRKVEIRGKDGIRIRRFSFTPDKGGLISGGLILPENVAGGTWTVRVLEGRETIASRKIEVVTGLNRLVLVEIEPEKTRFRLGQNASFRLTAWNRWGHPVGHEPLRFRVSGDPDMHSIKTDEKGRARVILPTDRFGLMDSIALDVHHGGKWIAGCVVPVVWDGFRASVECDRDIFLLGEPVRATVKAVSFDKVRQARDLTVVVRRVLEGGRSEDVCRVPVRTLTKGEDASVPLPIPGEGAFSLLLEGDEDMVPTGSALFIRGPDDPRLIRILAGGDPVRPGTTLKLRIHCRRDGVSAVMVAANHRDHRIRRIGLNRGVNEIPVAIRECDLPWIRIRIGAPVGKSFHSDEVTVAVEDPLHVTLNAHPFAGPPGRNVTLQLKVEDASGKPVRASAVFLMVPEQQLPMYRGFFQSVGELFMGDTRAEDSQLVSSYPFMYRGSGERVAILGERQGARTGFASNWAAVVDRNAVVSASRLGNNPVEQYAAVFARDIATNLSRGGQQIFHKQQLDVPRQQAQIQSQEQSIDNLISGASSSGVINPLFLNQGSGRVVLTRNEAARILGQGGEGVYSGTFQDLDSSRNGWNPARVMLCSGGGLVIPKEDLEMRLRRLAEQLLRSAPHLPSPRFFMRQAGEDGKAVVTLPKPEGKWRVLVLACSHEGARFGEAACPVEGTWKIKARVIGPRFPCPGEATCVDVLLTSKKAEQVPVRFTLEGHKPQHRTVQVPAGEAIRIRFPMKVGGETGRRIGYVYVGERKIPVTVEVVPGAMCAPDTYVRKNARGGEKDARSQLTLIRSLLEENQEKNQTNLGQAAWVVARIAEISSEGGDAGEDADLETRLAWLLLGGNRDGGWTFAQGERTSDVETSVLVAWALGAAQKVGLQVPAVVKSRLISFLKKEFSKARDETAKTPLLLALSRLESVEFAHVNRLYRARQTLSGRDLAILLLLVRRQGDDGQMVKALAELLMKEESKDGTFGTSDVLEPLGDVRSTTAISALALFGLKSETSRQAIAALDLRPMCPAREAAGLALEAALREEIRSPGVQWRIQRATDGRKKRIAKVIRRVRYKPMRFREYTLSRGFDVAGHYKDRGCYTRLVGEGKRFQVRLHVELPYSMAHAMVEEAIPSGMRLVPGSVNSNATLDEKSCVLHFHIYSRDRNRKGKTWYSLTYELETALPGAYVFRHPVVTVLGGPPVVVKAGLETERITAVPIGEDDRKEYQVSPREHEALGRIYWSIGRHDKAYHHLKTLLKTWRPKQAVLVRVAALLLDMDVRWKNQKGMVEHFEMLKEGDPDRSVPFRKILPVAEAYALLGEHERALQVQRGCLDGFFQVDFGFGNALLAAGDLKGFRAFLNPLLSLYPAGEVTRDSRYFFGQTMLAQARRTEADSDAKRNEFLQGAERAFRAVMEAGGGGAGTEASAFARAGTLLEQEQYDAAACLCERAAELFADSHLKDGFEYVLAYSLFELGRYEKAEKICELIVTGEYRNASGGRGPSMNQDLALHMLAKIHHARGAISRAVEAYRKVKKKFSDADLALKYFEWRVLDLPELAELAVNEDRTVRLTYKNIDSVQVRAFRVDLMTLYLRERSLNRIANINLAGIKPFFEGVFPVRPSTYRMDDVRLDICRKGRQRSGPGESIAVVLPDPGAYLLVIRSGETECMGMVLRTDLRMDVQTVRKDGTLRATVYDRTSGSFSSRVDVKFVGSQDKAFTSARTDLRGVAEATGIHGQPTVIARKGDQYAFYRSSQFLGRRQTKRSYGGPSGKVPADLRLDNFNKQLDVLNMINLERVKEQQKSRGGVKIKSVK